MTKPITIPNTFASATSTIPLSQLDQNFSALQTAINDPATYSNYAVDAGATNAYIITLNPEPSSLASIVGLPITFKPSNNNTGASTININSFGVINILNFDNSILNSNQIVAGNIVQIAYNGTNYILLSSTGATTGILPVANGGTGTATGGNLWRNKIINGAMQIDQRNAGASVTQIISTLYTCDRFGIIGTVTSKFTAQQNAGSVTPPVGYINYLGATSSSPYSVLSSDWFAINQRIEGLNVSDLGWGTANASTVTLSFWVRSSLTGTFGVMLFGWQVDRPSPMVG